MKDILTQISDCIVNMEEDRIEGLIVEAVNLAQIGIDDIYSKGLNDGMVRAIALFEEKSYHIPEVIVCADTLNKGLKLLNSYGNLNRESKGKIALAVVKGDTHEIGKNIVKIMLEASGYEVLDLGVNREQEDIITEAIAEGSDVIGLSSMMTTTMTEMKSLIEKLESMKLDKKPFVVIGGGCISAKYADEIGADGYSENAPKAVKLIKNLMERED